MEPDFRPVPPRPRRERSARLDSNPTSVVFLRPGCPSNGIKAGSRSLPGRCSRCVAPHGPRAAPSALPWALLAAPMPNVSPAAGEVRVLLVEQVCGCLTHPRGETLMSQEGHQTCFGDRTGAGCCTPAPWDSLCCCNSHSCCGNGFSPSGAPAPNALISLPEHPLPPSALISHHISCIPAPRSPQTSLPLFQLCRGGC